MCRAGNAKITTEMGELHRDTGIEEMQLIVVADIMHARGVVDKNKSVATAADCIRPNIS